MKNSIDKVRNYRLTPSPEVWKRIEVELNKGKQSRRPVKPILWLGSAAAAVIILPLVFILLSKKEYTKNWVNNIETKTPIINDNLNIAKAILSQKNEKTPNVPTISKKSVSAEGASSLILTDNVVLPNLQSAYNTSNSERNNLQISLLDALPVSHVSSIHSDVKKEENIKLPTLQTLSSDEQRIQTKWLQLLAEELLEEKDSTLTERMLNITNRKTISLFQDNIKPALLHWYLSRKK